MENIIKLLPEHISNQIAAGEVVQRPASVVKELVENAIDAGAQNIEIHIHQAGKASIQVIDDGCGMSLVDAKMAFERHATSKIQKVDDIYALHTKGFRGEAIPSIASIAHVHIKTKRKEDEVGTLIVNEGGKIIQQEPVVCKDGTSIEVKNLFFNVPARRNFLKKDTIEFKHIEEEFLRIALIHCGVGLSLFHDNKRIYQLPIGNHRKRIVDIFGRSMNDKLMPIHADTEFVKISGFVMKPEFSQKTKGKQYFFVNDRFFKDAYFHNAVMKAFDGMIPAETYPGYFIHIEVNPAEIDVNVHPTKTEVKFENQQEIYLFLNSAIREALGKFNIFPSLDFDAETSFDLPYEERKMPVVEPKIRVNPNYNPFNKTSSSGYSTKSDSDYANKSLQSLGFGQREVSSEDWKEFYTIEEENTPEQSVIISSEETLNFEAASVLILKNIALLSKDGMVWVVDLSAVKERLLFDQFFQTFIVKPVPSQQLLFAIEEPISHHEEMVWKENELTIQRLGFEWEIKEEMLHVMAVPNVLDAENVSYTLQQMREKMQEEHFEKSELAHLLIQSMSISNAQNLKWTERTVKGILNEWSHCEEKWESPSGKVIVKTYQPKDLLK